MIKKALVTGGTGVTGNALVKYLLQQHIEVTALVRPNSFRRKHLPKEHPQLTILECGMEDYKNIADKLEKYSYDAFFHLSWDGSTGKEKVDNRNNFRMQNQNVSYALDAVELCHAISCPVFVMTGSQAEYGRKNVPVTETMEKHPENGYGMAKLCAEGMTRLLCKQYGIRHIWPILFSIYGPCDGTESLIDTSIRNLLKSEKVHRVDERCERSANETLHRTDLQSGMLPYTAGDQEWDYLYSYDAARALLLLAEHGEDGEVYHVANGQTRPLKEYLHILYQVVAPNLKPRLGEVPYGPNQVMYLGADISKLKKQTGFVPQYSFEEGIQKIKESMEEEAIL